MSAKPKVQVYGRDCAKNYEGPLEPADPKRCQHERTEYNPFAFGPVNRTIRCEAKPVVIATEKKSTRKDRKKGSMSLCLKHMAMLDEHAPWHCTFKKIKRQSESDGSAKR